MNTIIAQGRKSNDSTAMSPALTQEHSQDVVDVKHELKHHGVISKSKSIPLAGSLSRDILYCSNHQPTVGNEELSDVPTVDKFGTASKLNVIDLSSNDDAVSGCRQNGGVTTTDLLQQNSNMTPRIVLPCCIDTAELQSVDPQPLMASSTLPDTKVLGIETGTKSITNDSSSQPVVPSISNLSMQVNRIIRRNSVARKRLHKLQSVFATRHTKQQLTAFVENQCKHRTSTLDGEVSAMPSTSLSNSYSVAMSNTTTEELNNMSTSALVELVQRIQTAKNAMHTVTADNRRKSSVVTVTTEENERIQAAAGVMSANLTKMTNDIDSDATASSSGGETDDDDVIRSNTFSSVSTSSLVTSTHNLKKKACWRWTRDRAMVISRWTWLQAQVSDLEYRIRQHGEIHKRLRSVKLSILPGFKPPHQEFADESATQRAARCMPLRTCTSQRHKLVRVSHAPALDQKARRPVMVQCQCVQTIRQCAICAGHHHYAKPLDIQTLSSHERISQLDHSFHPVLSFGRDVNPCLELEEVVNSVDKDHGAVATTDKKLLKMNKKLLAETLKKQKLELKLKKAKEKSEKKAKKRKAVEAKLKAQTNHESNNKKRKFANGKKIKSKKVAAKRVRLNSQLSWDEEEEEEILEQVHAECSLAQSATSTDLNKSSANKRMSQYDIDDIVIPYHIAAATRVEKLQYKEIDTPRWRECTVNGDTVHEQVRRRSSSTSVPVTPITPALSESRLPTLETLPVENAGQVGEGMTPPLATLSINTTDLSTSLTLPSERSSTSSLATLEAEEDISDGRFMTRHSISEAKEKSRYLTYVTSARRPRTHSATIHHANPPHTKLNNVAGSLPSPGSQQIHSPDLIHQQQGVEQTQPGLHATQAPPSQTSSMPLSASHDTAQLKEELAAVRKRSSSFTANRLRRDQSQDVQEKAHIQPWPVRSFPLVDEDVKTLNFDPDLLGTAPAMAGNETSWDRQNDDSHEQWKVVSGEEEVVESCSDKKPIVLKLSKT